MYTLYINVCEVVRRISRVERLYECVTYHLCDWKFVGCLGVCLGLGNVLSPSDPLESGNMFSLECLITINKLRLFF